MDQKPEIMLHEKELTTRASDAIRRELLEWVVGAQNVTWTKSREEASFI